MDLDRLKIDRRPAPARSTRKRSSGKLGRVLFWAAILACLSLFWRPAMRWIDRLRLPGVQVTIVERSHPAQVGAVAGKAANGYIVAARRAALSADTPGRITELLVEEGSVVERGQLVARLYSEEVEASLQQALAELEVAEEEEQRANLERQAAQLETKRQNQLLAAAQADALAQQALLRQLERDLAREQQLLNDELITLSEVENRKAAVDDAKERLRSLQAQAESAATALESAELREAIADSSWKVAKAQIKARAARRSQIQATLEKLQVRAPFDGIVVLKDAEVGEVVSPNSQGGSNARGSVCTMVDFDSLEVQADVPETSLAAVHLNATTQIFLDAYPNRTYFGEVSRIWPTANRQKATVEVRITFDEPDELLRPEMGVRVVFADDDQEIPTDVAEPSEPVIVISRDCLVRQDGQDGVFVVERDVVQFRVVQLGDRRGSSVTIQQGLAEGEQVVLNPPASLENGDRVQLQESS